jgi:uncharacterized repeat protein (TIGR03803 family)
MRLLRTDPIFLAAASLLVLAGCAGGQQGLQVMPVGGSPSTLSRASATETVIHSFGASGDGSVPHASLLNVNGTLYGTTTAGGKTAGSLCFPGGCGTVYRVTTDGQENVVYSFSGADGAAPSASLVDVKGTLYGTTGYGGAGGLGTVFSVTQSGKESVLHSFMGKADGASPDSNLIEFEGKLYGTTSEGGAHNYGNVFCITPSGREKVLYSFKGGSYGDGSSPQAGLTELGGVLYGTTFRGGSGAGTVFKLTLSGNERVIYRFAPYRHDAQGPGSALVYLNGRLYGTTWFGGSNYGSGTVFSVTTSGKEKVLHSFKGSPDGAFPFGGLVNVNSTLYGTTWEGGISYGETNSGVGTVFSIDPSGKERMIYRFGPPPDAALPGAGLIDVNGTLFGTAASGGTYSSTNCPGAGYAYGCGAVFALPLSAQRRQSSVGSR